MTKYEWREQQMKINPTRQLQAERRVEEAKHDKFVEVYDTSTGEKMCIKSRVADLMRRKKQVENSKLVFTMPDTSHIDWSK